MSNALNISYCQQRLSLMGIRPEDNLIRFKQIGTDQETECNIFESDANDNITIRYCDPYGNQSVYIDKKGNPRPYIRVRYKKAGSPIKVMMREKAAVFLFLSYLKTNIAMDKCITCFYCGSSNVVKKGKTYYLKQRYKCKDCKRQFMEERKNFKLCKADKQVIGDLLLEGICLEGICRVLKISPYHLYTYMEKLYKETPGDLYVNELLSHGQDIDLACFECENDEAWSFLGQKSNKPWIWVSRHQSSRMIVGVCIGEGGEKGARGRWEAIPQAVKKNTIFHTDDWDAYKKVFQQAEHRPSKQKKQTNHIERFWATLRQFGPL